MSKQIGKQQETVGDALARRIVARRGAASAWAEALRELGAVDRAVYEAVARTRRVRKQDHHATAPYSLMSPPSIGRLQIAL